MEDYILINELAGSRIVAKCNNMQLIDFLTSLGFKNSGTYYIKQVNEEERIKTIKILIKNGALFSEGRDWSPAELVLYYREKGIINEKFKSISWTNPKKYNIIER
jgi:transposase